MLWCTCFQNSWLADKQIRDWSQYDNGSGKEVWCSHSFRLAHSEIRNARLFVILFVRNFWRVCSQFWLSVRNSVWGPFNRNSRGNPSFSWLGGGGGSYAQKLWTKILWTNWRFLWNIISFLKTTFSRKQVVPYKIDLQFIPLTLSWSAVWLQEKTSILHSIDANFAWGVSLDRPLGAYDLKCQEGLSPEFSKYLKEIPSLGLSILVFFRRKETLFSKVLGQIRPLQECIPTIADPISKKNVRKTHSNVFLTLLWSNSLWKLLC